MPKTDDRRPKSKVQRPKTKEVVAILLAAGQSRRMGDFKPLLPFGKTTVIRSCVRNLKDAGIESIVVVLGHRADDVKQSLSDINLKFVINPHSESEMSASIACGVKELPKQAGAVLIALTDQPAIPPVIIQGILAEWRSGNRLIVPEFEGRGGHPVLVDLSWREELLNLDSETGLKSLFQANRNQVKRLKVSSPYVARDMDTWDDYRVLHEEIFGVLPDPIAH